MSISKKGFLAIPGVLENQFTLYERGRAIINSSMVRSGVTKARTH
jgi:hypothetical protein